MNPSFKYAVKKITNKPKIHTMKNTIFLLGPEVSNPSNYIWIPCLLIIFFLLRRFLKSKICKDCQEVTIGRNRNGDPQCKGCRRKESKFHNEHAFFHDPEEEVKKK